MRKGVSFVLVVLVVVTFCYLWIHRGGSLYTNNVYKYQFVYPKAYTIVAGPLGVGEDFTLMNKDNLSAHNITGSIMYAELSQIEHNYESCYGDCPAAPPIITHVTVAGQDSLRIISVDLDKVEAYYIPIPSDKTPIAILWLQTSGKDSDFSILESIVESVERIH